MRIRSLGSLHGTDILGVTIAAGDIEAEVMTLGAILRSLVLRDGREPTGSVVLGFPRAEDYLAGGHFGAIAGRVANRIGGGRFTLDGTEYQLTRNERGRTHLHGGANAFGLRPWRLLAASDDAVELGLTAYDGEDGYPGTVEVLLRYSVLERAVLRLDLEATCDRATPLNLCEHHYFNLDGTPTISDHRLTVAASQWTVLDTDQVPTGQIAPVEGTPHDFRSERAIHDGGGTHDLNFVLDREQPGLVRAAVLKGPRSGRTMELWTTEPGLQLYDARGLESGRVGSDGRSFGRFAGLCLEAQHFPNAPNLPDFPSVILRPGERYTQCTELRFV